MISLVNGKPIFYIGKINGIGYTSEEEKEMLIRQLKEENPDIEIKDEPIKVDKDLKQKVIELGELQLTYSKSEFMKYLNGEKYVPELKILELEQVNQINLMALMELNRKLLEMGGDE